MPSSRSDWDDDADVDAFSSSSSSRSSTSWIASEGMASVEDFLWSGVEVSLSVSISEANGESGGSGTVREESEWEDELLVEENFDFDESLEIAVGMVENDVNEVDRLVEGGDFDLNFDYVEELVQEDVQEEADWMGERIVSVSFGHFMEEECDLEESLDFFQELGGSEGAEQDHVTTVVDLEETLDVDGNSLANSSDVVDNSNLEGDFDFADSLGIRGDGMEESHTSEENLDFEDNTASEGDINLEANNPSSDGLSWGFVDSLRGVSRDDVILGDYVMFGGFDNESSVEQIFDQIIRSDTRRTASSAASKDIVERLPVMEVKEGMFEGCDSDGACAVCKNNVQVGERVRRLPCLHYFHEECIIPWLEIRNTCPLCRHELPTEDARNEGIRRRVDSGSQDGGSSPNQLL